MWASYRSISTGRLTDTWTLCSNSSTKDYEKRDPGPWRNLWIDGQSLKTCLLWSPNTSDTTTTTKVYEDSNPCLQHSFLCHQSARGRLVFQEINLYVRFNRLCSRNNAGSVQECEYEWLIFSNASSHCYCYRPFLLWKCRDSIQRSARMCPDSLVTFTNAVYGCEHSITDEHEQTPSDLQLRVCRDITKCCRTNYLSNHSKIEHIACCSDTNHIHPSKQERSCYVIGRVCYRNDRDRDCPHLFLLLNKLVLKVDIYCSIQRCGPCTCENETKVEVMTCVFVCSYAFIFVDSSETCLYTLYEIIKMLCLVNITTYRWYLLIVNAMRSGGDGVRPGRGRTANQQNGVVVFLCSGSHSFNSALARPS